MNEHQDKDKNRWDDRWSELLSIVLVVGALIGWLHSDWMLGSRLEAIEKNMAMYVPIMMEDHDWIKRTDGEIHDGHSR